MTSSRGEREAAIDTVTTDPALVECTNVSRTFGSGPTTVHAVRDVNCRIPPWARIAGQRISHRPEPERARIRARHIGMLFQNANLLDHLTVAQNLSLVRSLAGRAHRADRPDLLSLLGLSERAAAYPGQLSGGELARAGLAIALANHPAALLADEPTGELDSVTESRVLDLLSVAAAGGTAILVASHSPAVAAAAARVIRLDDGRVC